MRVLIITPSLGQHGGIRTLVSWANGLLKWHSVGIYSIAQDNPSNMYVNHDVRIIKNTNLKWEDWDCLIIGSPHGIKYKDAPVKKKVIFMQMCEHLFKPGDRNWKNACVEFYGAKYPMILISLWNHQDINYIRYGLPTYYLGNGVSFDDFPINDSPMKGSNEKFGKTVVLVEGWEATNPTKDTDAIGARVAKRLKAEGYYIIGYSQLPLRTFPKVPNEYHSKPSLKVLNSLYERATVMIKATRFDARSTAPLEAMTKYCAVARAIQKGDDDLIHEQNCLRCGYNEDELYSITKRLLDDVELRSNITENAAAYVQKYSWDYWMPKINDIILHS